MFYTYTMVISCEAADFLKASVLLRVMMCFYYIAH